MNLVLIGYRGTGKTTLSELLSEELGLPRINLDAEIVRRAGKPIPEIVAEKGWDFFRDLEEEMVADAVSRDNQILDCGGGVIVRPQNIERLKRNGLIFLLYARPADIVARISGDTERPSLTGKKSFTEEVEEVLEQRWPRYLAAADFVIDTSSLGVGEARAVIARKFRERTEPGRDQVA